MKGLNDWKNTHSQEMGNQTIERLWNAVSTYKNGYSPNVEDGHAKFMTKISNSPAQKTAKVIGLRPILILRVAATITLLVSAVFIFNKYFAEGGIEKVATTEFEKQELVLIDGSEITLNGASELIYPVEFSDTERTVNLKGEGFFNVEKDPIKPFIVKTRAATIQVLGTSFNVRAFDNESLEVLVTTGRVEVELSGISQKIQLSPGDLLKFDDDSGKYILVKDEGLNAIAWKEGRLRFSKQPFSEILTALEKLHNVEITAENPDLLNCIYTFNPKSIGWEELVADLETGCEIKFVESGKSSFKVKGSCCD